MEPKAAAPQKIKIPLSLTGQIDIKRLVREISRLDEFFLAAKVRRAGTPIQPPRLTRILSDLAQTNRLNLLQQKDRDYLRTRLEAILKEAPNLHISFATEPSPKALEQIIAWLRNNIHPDTLVVVGLQPGIAAGMVLRTPNKIFDMSMRNYLLRQSDYLVKLIDGAARG